MHRPVIALTLQRIDIRHGVGATGAIVMTGPSPRGRVRLSNKKVLIKQFDKPTFIQRTNEMVDWALHLARARGVGPSETNLDLYISAHLRARFGDLVRGATAVAGPLPSVPVLTSE
jgi:hypothetical protein